MEKLKSQNGFAVQRFSELMHLINSISYGNHQGKGIDYWCSFIKQCHVSSLIQLELKSMSKAMVIMQCKVCIILYQKEGNCYPSLGIHDSSSPSTVHSSDTPKCTSGSIEGKGSRL